MSSSTKPSYKYYWSADVRSGSDSEYRTMKVKFQRDEELPANTSYWIDLDQHTGMLYLTIDGERIIGTAVGDLPVALENHRIYPNILPHRNILTPNELFEDIQLLRMRRRKGQQSALDQLLPRKKR